MEKNTKGKRADNSNEKIKENKVKSKKTKKESKKDVVKKSLQYYSY